MSSFSSVFAYTLSDLSSVGISITGGTISDNTLTVSGRTNHATITVPINTTIRLDFTITSTSNWETTRFLPDGTNSNIIAFSHSDNVSEKGRALSFKGNGSGWIEYQFGSDSNYCSFTIFPASSDGASGDSYQSIIAFDEITVNGVTSSVPLAKSYYTLQNGWLSVIDLGSSGSEYEFDLDTTFQMNSDLISGTWGNGTSQRYWFSNNLPDENTSYLSTFGNAIYWQKGYPRNIFGQTKNATCTITGTSTGRYLYILNPALQQIADVQNPSVSPGVNNHPMTISGLTDGMSAKIYKLTGTATLEGLNNAVDINSGGSVTASDSSSDLTNSFTNDDDETVVQNAGGGNENEVAQTVNGYLQGIQNALDNFVNQFISLLSAPISHIQQMIDSGSNFFSVFGQLFTWLPQEISVIITGSLLLMVIIGVFKMFL